MISEITNKAKIIFGRFEQKIDVIELDLVSSRSISEKTEITQNPVEGGFINDHIRDQPTEIVITAIISKFSIRLRNFAQANLGAITTAQSFLTAPTPDKQPQRQQNRLQVVHDQLYALKDKKEPIILKMPRKDYENMFLASLDFSDDPNTGESLRFTASFKEVKFATSQTTTIDNSKIKTQSAKKKENIGRQTANPATPAIPTKPIGLWDFIKSPGGKF